MTTIIGVDFSGAEREGKTWIARGVLTEDGTLQLKDAWRIKRECLYELLVNVTAPAVAAMDFPFGVPVAFATQLRGSHEPAAMPEVWQSIADMRQADFIAACNQFVKDHREPHSAADFPWPAGTTYCHLGEPLRTGDAKYISVAFSTLHSARPSMLQMTYHGISLLKRWHDVCNANRWRVPPLNSDVPDSDAVTLMETMPGAFLQVCGLPSSKYKNNSCKSRTLRNNILDGLPTRSGWPDLDLSSVRAKCLQNDDCLDAVVAFVCAASWARCQDHFHHPIADELADARLEGWIYVPKSICTHHSAG